ncbi:hypothetical protein BN946_scf184938.g45 [Trametes cinnabarina]|uniref:Uncharacterized protein n=1 Tax=Pycnoporus cinnabarinus TaxID=5643 RepID=A0A060S729_PYCCI|nr:hypothetical protein BN946_scf184938.g45 [Trametes cinnabarina]
MVYSSAFFAIALALSGQAVHATPTPAPILPSLPTSFPIVNLDIFAASSNVSLARHGLHAETTENTPGLISYLYLCESPNCAGTCTFTNLGGIEANECTLNNPFVSAIIQQTYANIAYEVVVGPRECPEVVALPSINVCYNLSGATFEGYAVLE